MGSVNPFRTGMPVTLMWLSGTLRGVSSFTKATEKSGATVDGAAALGLIIGKKAQENGVTEVVFDRGGNLYHGRIKAVADGAREAGLKF